MTFQLTEATQKSYSLYFHKVFSSLYRKLSYSYLLFSLALWIVYPILGIVPLLIFCQMKVSRNLVNKKSLGKIPSANFFILLIVIFTTTIVTLTYPIVGDLKGYVELFNSLGSNSFLEQMSERGMEPISYFLPYILKSFFDINFKQFIFLQSFTLNFAFVAISVYFLPSFYPIAILFNTTSFTYFLQTFLMRQYYSFIFLVPCIFSSRLQIKLLFAVLAYYTHNSTIFFSLPTIILSLLIQNHKDYDQSRITVINKFLHLLRKRIRYLLFQKSFLLIFSISLPLLLLLILILLQITGNNLNAYSIYLAYSELSDYSLGLPEDIWKGAFFEIFFIGTSLFLIRIRHIENSSYLWLISFILSLFSLFLFYSGQFLFGRNIYFIAGLGGFFYSFIFLSGELNNYSQKYFLKSQPISLLLMSAIFFKSIFFIYKYITLSTSGDTGSFGTGLLEMNLIDYFHYIYDYLI
jgi:hypothetical protein